MFHPHSLQPGDVFAGDFRIERPLAMGGMGAVYVAEQISTGRKRALKLMLPSLVQNARTRERFEQEAKVGSRIASDHVVEVVAAGVDPSSGAPWLAMELLDGQTLAARIERGGPLSLSETLEVFRQLCHALAAAHSAGLVHRDIKPENLYLARPRREGIPFTLKLLDFGIAKLTEDVRGNGGVTSAVGSPMWMAPEQTSSNNVLPATDVWALGLVAFFCLTGRSYWRAASSEDGTLQGLLTEVVVGPLETASARASASGNAALLPPGFDAWFARAVTREPTQRFADAAQAFAALAPVLAGSAQPAYAVTAAPTAAPAASNHRTLLRWVIALLSIFVLGALLMVGGVGLAFGYWFSLSRSGDDVAAAPAASTPETPEPPATSDGVAAAPPPQATPPPSGTAATKQPSAAGAAAPSAAAAPTGDTQDKRADYKLAWYKQKITQCWKGNEGSKPDAGAHSVTITVTIGENGRASKASISPNTHKGFTGCAMLTSHEHPWGKGPIETKSFSFSF